jgi:hypothetical protein
LKPRLIELAVVAFVMLTTTAQAESEQWKSSAQGLTAVFAYDEKCQPVSERLRLQAYKVAATMPSYLMTSAQRDAEAHYLKVGRDVFCAFTKTMVDEVIASGAGNH